MPKPSTPQTVSVTEVTDTSITLTWAATKDTREYRLGLNRREVTRVPITAPRTYTHAGLEPGTTYEVSVSACNTSGCSSPRIVEAVTDGEEEPPPPTPCPDGSITIRTVADIANAPSGATLCFAGDLRVEMPVRPKTGQTWIGQDGARLIGSKDISTGWVRDGDVWKLTGQPTTPHMHWLAGLDQDFSEYNDPTSPYADDVYYEQLPLKRVGSRDALDTPNPEYPGNFYYDYPAGTIYMNVEPQGDVELAFATGVVESAGSESVTLRGLTIQGSRGLGINGSGSWLVDDCLLTLNHAAGIRYFQELRGVRSMWNGMFGLAGSGDFLITDTEHAFNNYARYRRPILPSGQGGGYWSAGGSKFVHTHGARIIDCWGHDNWGDAYWFDGTNDGLVYEGGIMERNERAGINHEIAQSMTARGVTCRNNKGPGIVITESRDVDVAECVFGGNGERKGVWAKDGPRSQNLSNVRIHDNTLNGDLIVGCGGPVVCERNF